MTEENEEEAGAEVRFPPPFVPLIALGAALGIETLMGPFFVEPTGLVRWVFGGVFLLAGVGCIAGAGGLFRKTGQDPKPWKPSPQLIAEGIYQRTRNPMYLGMCLAQAGLGILFGTLWGVALVPVTGLVIYLIAIRHEESYLRGKFGADYEAYLGRVRRWL
jgi:protein-S-isoprenylcysteine O-methyltransferase Ste14